MFKKYIFTFLFCGISSLVVAQKNYFYADMKLPLGNFVLAAIKSSSNTNQENVNPKDSESIGGGLDFGYGFNLKENWYLETGIEFFGGKSVSRTYDYSSVFVSRHKIDFSNYALTVPAKLVYRLEEGDTSFWHFSLGLGFQSIFSKGQKYTYQKFGEELRMIKDENFGTKNTFNINIQPALAFFFAIGKRSQMGLELSYLTINWDKNFEKFAASDQFNLGVPNAKIADVFTSIKFLF